MHTKIGDACQQKGSLWICSSFRVVIANFEAFQPCLETSRLFNPAYSLHCSSFLGLPFRVLCIELVKPKTGTTMETLGKHHVTRSRATFIEPETLGLILCHSDFFGPRGFWNMVPFKGRY